jgi:hypothetical protein
MCDNDGGNRVPRTKFDRSHWRYEGKEFKTPIGGTLEKHTVLRKILGGREAPGFCRTQNAHSATGERHLGFWMLLR